MRAVIFAILVTSLTLPSLALAAQPVHLRVIWHEAPASSAIVSWSTPGPTETRLVWGLDKGATASAYDHNTAPTKSGTYDEDTRSTYHHAQLEGLPSSTPIHFRIDVDGDLSRDYWFVTAPDDARPFVILYGGDSRSDSPSRRAMNERMRDLVEADPSVIALVHGGDYIETGSSWQQWDQWLDDWQATTSSDGRVLPIVPARGNHEGDAELYNNVFAFPGDARQTGDWWATQIGSDFLLLNLDSNVSQAGSQREWLEEMLKEGQQYRWLAANYHRPAYPAVKSPGGALYHWVPLFEQYNVEMVLESDGHVLKRTMPIRDGQFDPTGVVYMGEGGLGVPQRTPDKDLWYLQPPGMARSGSHVQALRVTPDAVYYSAIMADGEVADTYTFKPRRRGQYAEPTVEKVRMLGANDLEIVFTRPVEELSAESASNYAFDPAVEIASIEYADGLQLARVQTAEPLPQGYRVIIDGVVDVAGKGAPRTVFRFPSNRPAGFPVDAILEESGGPTATDQITELPIGPPIEGPTEPLLPSCACSTPRNAVGGALLSVLLLGGLIAFRRLRPQ